MKEKIRFLPMKIETVVVLRGTKVIGTIKRYRTHKACLVSIPGLLSAAANPGQASFKTVPEAKKRILELDKEQK